VGVSGGTGVGATFNVTIGNTATVGPIATLGAITAGAGTATVPSVPYSAPYAAVPLTGGTGTGATANITVSNTAAVGPIATVGAFTPGSGTVNVAATTYTNSLVGAATTVTGTAGVGATLDVTINETAGVGPVFSVDNFNTNAAGGISQTYTNVPATGGSGSLVTLDIVTDISGNIVAATVNSAGSGYTTGDTLNVVGAAVGGGDFDIDVDFVTLPIAVTAAAINGLGTGYDNASVLSILSASIDNIVGFSVPVTTFTVPVGVTAVAPVGLGTGFTANDPLSAAPAAIGGVTGFSVLVATVTLPTGVTNVVLNNPGTGYTAGNTLTVAGALVGGAAAVTFNVATITGATTGALSSASAYAQATGLNNGSSGADLQSAQSRLVGVYFDVSNAGTAPDNTTAIVAGDRIAVTFDGSTYTWAVVPASTLGGDLTTVGQVLYESQVQMTFTPEQAPPSSLWNFDAITSTELIDNALRGTGFNGVPQAVFIERGIDNVNALYDDSQRYFNPFGFIAYYGPWIENGAGVYVPPSPYVTGVAARRYRSEGYQFPPAGVKYQLADAVAAQIPINSAQQNLLNPDGCNAIRTLPGYPQSAVFIWGGRTRVNTADSQQRLYQFVNTRVILNVVYGSLRSAFDSQIFNVIDGFGVIYNQIISVGNSVLNQLYVRGALFGARPSDAFQVICDSRINSAADAENGVVNAKVFVTPVPTLERIQIDLIRVAIGQMQNELDLQGLGQNNG
jgi:hypothetical protein